MNNSYNETVTRNGKTYHYDPDHDCYYPRSSEGPVSKYAWIVLCIVLAVVAYCIEHTHLPV